MSIDKAGATAELTQALGGEQPTEATPTQDVQTSFYELPWQGSTLKIPMNHKLPLKENGAMEDVELSSLFNGYRNHKQMQRKYEELHKAHNTLIGEIGDRDAYNANREKYGAIQKWSEENPAEWERLYEMFQNRDRHLLANGAQPNNEMADTINSLRQEIEQLKSGPISQYQKDLQDRENQEVINKVNGQIEAFQKDYPEIDLNEKDVDGVDKKSAIINFGIQNGYPDFTSAAYAMLGKDLVKAAEERGRKSLAEQVKKDKANGIVARQSIPQNGSILRGTDNRSSKMDHKALATEELRDLLAKR